MVIVGVQHASLHLTNFDPERDKMNKGSSLINHQICCNNDAGDDDDVSTEMSPHSGLGC